MVSPYRQVARALQGKTWIDNASNVMSDESHETDEYMKHIAANTADIERLVESMTCTLTLQSWSLSLLLCMLGTRRTIKLTGSLLMRKRLSIFCWPREFFGVGQCADADEVVWF